MWWEATWFQEFRGWSTTDRQKIIISRCDIRLSQGEPNCFNKKQQTKRMLGNSTTHSPVRLNSLWLGLRHLNLILLKNISKCNSYLNPTRILNILMLVSKDHHSWTWWTLRLFCVDEHDNELWADTSFYTPWSRIMLKEPLKRWNNY